MARVSRKQSSVLPVNVLRVYNAALYVRLSKEDSGYDNSDSIEMQQYLLEQYAGMQTDMRVVGVFCDNGATGTNFDRPDFERMMDAVRKREIDCIVVKDLSRFGRNYVETGYFLEKIFPFLGVRFVAVNDGYDTLKNENGDTLVVSLKNIVNSLFAKDISKKSGSALRRKQENGEFIGGWTPYGYLKSPEDKHKLVIDPETASVVRNIFTWRAEHVGYSMIARRLNEQNIPSPTMLHHLRGEFNKLPQDALNIWQAQMIKSITNNMVYAGHMAQGKQFRSLCDGVKPTDMEKEDWIIVQNTHEPLVDSETFAAVQAQNEQQKIKANEKQGRHPTTENIFVGLVFCADCGKTMMRNKNRSQKGTVRYTFVCRTRRDNIESTSCTLKSIGEPELIAAILKGIQTQIELTIQHDQFLKKLKALPDFRQDEKELEKELQSIQVAVAQNTGRLSSAFEGYNDKLLSHEDYLDMKQKYTVEAERLLVRQSQLLGQQAIYRKTLSPQNTWIRTFQKYKGIKTLTREIVLELIHHITISDYNKYEITWNFKDEFQTLCGYTDVVKPKTEVVA